MLDLEDLEKYKENNRIEAKKAVGGLPGSIWETYSAFANTLGGYILLGVEELKDKSLHPILLPDPEGLRDEFLELLNDPKKVSRNILRESDVEIKEVEGKNIVVIFVPRAHRIDRPIYIDGDVYSGTYCRSGEGDYHCTRDEIRAMLRDASIRAQDTQIIEKMDLDVFDPSTLHDYRTITEFTAGDPTLAELSDRDFLKAIKAADNGADGKLHPTAAGLLMFGYDYEITLQFPLYHLEYSELWEGKCRFRLASGSGDWSGNICDFFRRIRNRLTQGLESGDGKPAGAVQEALINCLINADYYGRQGLCIVRDENGLTLSNPGGFRVDIDTAIRKGASDPRNSILIKMFMLMGMGHGEGSGLQSIYDIWKDQGLGAPTITQGEHGERTVISLPVRSRTERVSKNDSLRQKLADFLTEHVTADREELIQLFDGDSERVSQLIRQLLWERVIISASDNDRTVYRLRA